MTQSQRIARLEAKLHVQAAKGWRNFTTIGDGTYFETTGSRGDYRQPCIGANGVWPEGTQTMTRAEFDAIQAAGWRCLVVQYVDNLWGTGATT